VDLQADHGLVPGDDVFEGRQRCCTHPCSLNGQPATGESKTVTIRKAITLIQLAERAATGVVVNPLDWEDMELEKDDQGRCMLLTTVAVGAEERVWRTPVIPTTAMNEGRYLLGAFGDGAQLLERRGVNVQISTENQDMFERNAITVRAEERIALTVDVPESFVSSTLQP
jgi:HK97 family phage major capsid protein